MEKKFAVDLLEEMKNLIFTRTFFRMVDHKMNICELWTFHEWLIAVFRVSLQPKELVKCKRKISRVRVMMENLECAQIYRLNSPEPLWQMKTSWQETTDAFQRSQRMSDWAEFAFLSRVMDWVFQCEMFAQYRTVEAEKMRKFGNFISPSLFVQSFTVSAISEEWKMMMELDRNCSLNIEKNLFLPVKCH